MEVHHRGPLDCQSSIGICSISACFLGGQVLGDFPGLCKILHETTLLVTSMEPHGIPVVHTCLFPTFVGSGLSWFYFVWRMDVIGRRWSLMSWIFQCWSAGTNCARVSGRGFLLQDSPQALRWTISIPYHQQHVFFGFEFTSWSAWMSGLDFPVRGISLRRSVHDAGFVCGRDRWGTLCFFGIVCGHFFCWA